MQSKLYKILKDFCNQHYPKSCDKICYLSEEDMLEPSLKLFLYNIYHNIYSWRPFYILRQTAQIIFRKDHIADSMIWDAHYEMAKRILPVLKAFRKYPRHSYPSIYSEWSEEEGITKEKWDEYNKGAIGGKQEAWNKDIDEMIFAFEYTIEKDDWHSEFWKKYYGRYLDDEIDSNKHVHYEYNMPDDKEKYIGAHVTSNKEEIPVGGVIRSENIWHHDDNLEEEAAKRAQKGLELFAQRFFSIWD